MYKNKEGLTIEMEQIGSNVVIDKVLKRTNGRPDYGIILALAKIYDLTYTQAMNKYCRVTE